MPTPLPALRAELAALDAVQAPLREAARVAYLKTIAALDLERQPILDRMAEEHLANERFRDSLEDQP